VSEVPEEAGRAAESGLLEYRMNNYFRPVFPFSFMNRFLAGVPAEKRLPLGEIHGNSTL